MLVVGAGVAGLAAIGTATSLGAIIYAFDVRPEVAEQIESMGANFVFLDFEATQDGAATGGYAAPSSPEFREKQLAKFRELAPEMDIVITTALIPGRPAPKLWTEDMVEMMKPGSVIVDLAAERGGNCDLTVPDQKIVTDNGVTIVGYTDFPSRMAAQASTLYSTNIRHMLTDLTPKKDGVIVQNMEDDVIRGATVTHDGAVTFPPPPPKIAAIAAAKPKEKAEGTDARRTPGAGSRRPSRRRPATRSACWSSAAALLLLAGLYAPASFMQHFIVFVLSVFVGFSGDLERQPQPAHAADGGHQRDLVDHHPGGADADRVGQAAWSVILAALSVLMAGDQHLRRLHGHAAHACHVPEVVKGRPVMAFGFTTAAYVVAAVLFILSLGGLSGQESAKRAVWYGIVGMALAVAATLFGPGASLWLSVAGADRWRAAPSAGSSRSACR